MTSTLVDRQTQAMVQAIAAAEDIVRAEERAILSLLESEATARALARVRALRKAVQQLQVATNEHGRVWLENTLPIAYAEGATSALFDVGGPEFTWTQQHVDAASRLAADTYDDVLAASKDAGRTSEAFARHVAAAAREISAGNLASRTATDSARQITRRLLDQGVTGVTYKDGSRRGVADYMDMLGRTKVATAYNGAALAEYRSEDVRYLEVFDGFSCGWISHDDPDKAAGTVRPIGDCESFPISHPRCRRAFSARQDVTSHQEAAAARPSTTPEQDADQAAFEQATARPRSSASRRAAVLAKHGLTAVTS